MEVQNGVYKMVGIIFAIDGRDNTILAFPASAAQTAAGITFGEPLPPVPSLNEMDSFDDYAYGTWRALTDFDDVEHRLHNVDLYNSRVRWLGSSVPGTGPNYHWWSVGVPSGNENPTSVRFSVRGSPEIDEDFAQGRRWGFKVYVRHQGATAWTHAFSGEDVLSATGYTSGEDDNPIVVAGFEVPITNSADAVREYFQPYRNGEFEVKIEGAPIDPDVDLLGTLPEGDTTRSGSWSSDIASVHRSGRYARFYVFRLDRRGTLRLSLTSSVDTYMFLLDGAGKNGDLVERNDDRDYPDNLNSLITRTLDAGDYTIEATTFYEGTMGDFELGARLMSNDATLSGLDLSAGELIPAFTAGETSYTASVEHTQNTITVTPTANHASATITVNGVATTSGTESVALSLLAGDNTINVEVTAEDGTQRTYSIRVTRAASSTQGTPTQAPPPPPPPPDDDNDDDDDDCTEWVETGVNRGQCDDWEMQETRTCTNSEGESVPQTRWVSWEGPAETWGSWSSWAETSEHRGACDDWEIKETRTRTSNRCRTETQYQWVSWEGPAETWGSWSSWTETSETRGQCDDWEIKETRTRTSNRCRTQTQERWVTWEGPAETWGSWSSWSDTGSHRGSGMEREKEQERTRTSNRCRTQTEERWVADPESTPTPPVTETWGDWGAWTDTGTTRGTDEYREKEQSRTRTSNRNNTQTQTRWVSDE